jgi:hypothetical protein
MAQTTSIKSKKKQTPRTDNLLESLRDIGGDSFSSIKNEAGQIPADFFNQMFGWEKPKPRASGNLVAGQSLELSQAFEEQKQENQILRSRLAQEQSLRSQEQTLTAQKSQEIRSELTALVQEVTTLAKTTQGLARETEIAAMQTPTNPGVYHAVFFEKLRSFIISFRKKIENARLWMQASNQRAAKKKGFWGQVGQGGAKRLLSNEDYLQRSAG